MLVIYCWSTNTVLSKGRLKHNLAWVCAKLSHAFNWTHLWCGTRLCSFGSLVPRVSLESPLDLYKLNCHVDKQPAVRDLFFSGLWIAGNSHHGEQITP